MAGEHTGRARRTGSVHAFALRELTGEPWRNGGGVTRLVASGNLQIASSRVGATETGSAADDWDWRVSIADINVDGPFSVFPGVHRQLTLLEGEGLALHAEDTALEGAQQAWRASQVGDVLDFAGDARVRAQLLGGPVRVWNLMLRGDALRGHVQALRYNDASWVQPFTAGDATAVFVYVPCGELALRGSNHADGVADISLAAGQGLWLSHPPAGLRMQLRTPYTLALTTWISAPYSHHPPPASRL